MEWAIPYFNKLPENLKPTIQQYNRFINNCQELDKCIFWSSYKSKRKTTSMKSSQNTRPTFYFNEQNYHVKYLSYIWFKDKYLLKKSGRIKSNCGNKECINPQHLEYIEKFKENKVLLSLDLTDLTSDHGKRRKRKSISLSSSSEKQPIFKYKKQKINNG